MENISKNNLKITIENPKGNYKSFVDDGEESDYPLKGVTYPTDYGSIAGYVGEDGDDLDIFVGTGDLKGYIKVWRMDVPSETKFFVNLTGNEFEQVKKTFDPVLLESQILSKDDFNVNIEKFRA